MRDLAVLTFVTLDGVMQAPSMPGEDTSGGFARGGWAVPYWDGVMRQVQAEAMAQPYDMLFGRGTYDLFASHWPNAENSPVADKMNRARKYVVTSDPDGLHWNNSSAISGELLEELSRLKQMEGPLLQVHGSWQLIQFLIAHGLIDEFRLWVVPVVVGSGKRLFQEPDRPTTLHLAKTAACANGAVMCVYRQNRPDLTSGRA